MSICTKCGKEFRVSAFRRILGAPSLCPQCKTERDWKVQQYINAIEEFGRDKYLDDEEERILQELRLSLGLNDDDLKEANRRIKNLRLLTLSAKIDKVEQKIATFAVDGYLSKEEDAELAKLMASLGLAETELPERTRRELCDLRMLSRLRDGDLPILQTDLLLKKGEVCHFETHADLLETITKTRYVGGSSGVSIRIAPGVYYRVGGFRGKPLRETYNQVTDTGTLYITNKRVLFLGAKKSITYPINKIVSLTKHIDGIQFHKENETKFRCFLIDQKSHIDAIGIIVSRLAQERCLQRPQKVEMV